MERHATLHGIRFDAYAHKEILVQDTMGQRLNSLLLGKRA
jgi:hypothetical protein